MGDPRALHPLLRDEVYRIGREALINAFRHAQASHIEVMLTFTSHRLRLLVRDDGCGIDARILRSGRDGHWGLSGMRERADRIGAQLHLFSSASAGTELELTVPGRVAFQDQRSSRFRSFLDPLRPKMAARKSRAATEAAVTTGVSDDRTSAHSHS